ncbi:MAG TPA: AI-2E family transporter [Gammaproteobacteria bacterium]
MTSLSTKWFFAGVAATGILIYLLAPVLTPFLLGALFAYLGDPLVDRLEASKLSRTAAVIVVFLVFLLVILCLPLVLLPLIEQQIARLVANIPVYIDWLQNTVAPFLRDKFNIDAVLLNTEAVKQGIASHWRDMGGVASRVMGVITQSGAAAVAMLANLVLVPVVTFYLLRDWDLLVDRIHHLIPRQQEPVVSRLAKESDAVLGQFLRGQLTVMAALGAVYTTGLWIVGLDLALLVGIIAGLVSFVPYLGFIVGILLAGIAAIMQFGEPVYLLYIAIVFGIGQLLEGMVLTPWLVGDKIGLHPVAVIFAVMAGGQLFGFVGILIALPVAAVVVVVLRYVYGVYTESDVYGKPKTGEVTEGAE